MRSTKCFVVCCCATLVPCANIQGQTFSITFAEGVGFSFPIPTFTTHTADGQCQIQLSSTTGTPTIGANLLTFFYTFIQVESNTMGFALAAQSPVSAQAVKVTDANNLLQVTGVAWFWPQLIINFTSSIVHGTVMVHRNGAWFRVGLGSAGFFYYYWILLGLIH